MVEMDKKHAQLDNLITIVGQMRLGLSHRRDSEQNEAKKQKLLSCALFRLFAPFMSFFFMFFCAFLHAHANFYFFIYLLRFFYLFFSLFHISPCYFYFLYLTRAFLFLYFISYARVSVIFCMRKGDLGFVCCFSTFSTISAFFFCFPFSFYQSSVSAFSSFFFSSFS